MTAVRSLLLWPHFTDEEDEVRDGIATLCDRAGIGTGSTGSKPEF